MHRESYKPRLENISAPEVLTSWTPGKRVGEVGPGRRSGSSALDLSGKIGDAVYSGDTEYVVIDPNISTLERVWADADRKSEGRAVVKKRHGSLLSYFTSDPIDDGTLDTLFISNVVGELQGIHSPSLTDQKSVRDILEGCATKLSPGGVAFILESKTPAESFKESVEKYHSSGIDGLEVHIFDRSKSATSYDAALSTLGIVDPGAYRDYPFLGSHYKKKAFLVVLRKTRNQNKET